jgi:hypothetical protein
MRINFNKCSTGMNGIKRECNEFVTDSLHHTYEYQKTVETGRERRET